MKFIYSWVVYFFSFVCLGTQWGFSQLLFQPVSDFAISPAGTRSARPDTVLLDGKFWVAYLQLSPLRTFRVLILDKNLKLVASTNLFSGQNQPTDIRATVGSDNSFYYAFETTKFQRKIPNHLNIARYHFHDALPSLATFKLEADRAMPVIIPDELPRPGDDLMDDPAPFVYKGQFYVITRKWESAILKIRAFSPDFHPLKTYDLNLGKAFPGLYLSVNSWVEIDGSLYMVSGVFNGPPHDRRFFSYVAAVGLDKTITQVGRPIILSKTEHYEGYVACARYAAGKLFIGYDVLTDPARSRHQGMIKAFDPRNEFRELGSLQVNAGPMIDNHFTFEIQDNTLYVFYQATDESLRVKVVALK